MNWFHKKDGGLIKVYFPPHIIFGFCDYVRCSICGKEWAYPSSEHADKNWASFNDLPKDLQAAALMEML